MAEALVSALLNKLAPWMIHEFGLALDAKKDLRKLENTFRTIKDVLEDAESQSMKEKALFNWLAKLKDATYDMEDLLDYVERHKLEIHGHMIKKVRCFFSRSNPIIFRFKISHRVKEMRERLDEISEDRSKFNLKNREANDRKMEVKEGRETSSKFDEKNICGRDGDIETIVSFLLETNNEEEDVLILPIVGMGGLGKTTLAQLVYNDERVNRDEQFEPRSWVYVSEVFNPKKIAKDVILSATRKSCDQDNLDSIVNTLENLLREKKFLLVLDDVWNENENEWEKLKPIFNVGRRGSRIIVTTRNEKIALIMGNTTPHNLKGLSDEDCWKLFKQRAFGKESEKENSNLVQIGREIIKKCGGVPLAAKALGSTLQFKKEKDEWLAVRDSDIWKVEKEGDQVLASLRLSYTHLLPPVKQCFAYCSLFPKGYEFDKKIMISQWIAQGFVRPVDGSPPMEIIANKYFNDLLWMSFLQKFEDYSYGDARYKMHDLVHDLAGSVAGDEVLVEKAEKVVTGLKKGCRYAALMGDIASTKVPTNSLKKIRALHVFDNKKYFSGSILSSAKCLRTLDLSGYARIKSLPKLSNLRYIRTSIKEVKILPEYICGLRNLQFVYLRHCGSLRTLPESIGNLRNLRNLKLIGCGSELEPFPDSFGSLEHLVSLDLSRSRIELVPIKSFGGLQNLQSINLSGCNRLKELPDSIGGLQNLQSINLSECNSLEELPDSIGGLQNLQSINLSRCHRLKELPDSIGGLQNLQSINLSGCIRLKELPDSIDGLQNLQSINLSNCLSLEELPDSIGDAKNLRSLNMGECFSLRALPESTRNLTHLESLNLDRCGELQELPKGLEKMRNLKHLNIGGCDRLRGMPRGMRQMTNLETLPLFVVGKEEDSGYSSIGELEHINHIEGELTIRNLERVRNRTDATKANLKEKRKLHSLELVWREEEVGDEIEEGVLECLQPPPSIKTLSIEGYSGSKIPSWLASSDSLPNPNLEEAATLFPRLKKLRIERCPKLKGRPCIPASVEKLSIRDSRDEELLSDTSLQFSSRLRKLEINSSGTSSAKQQWTGLRHLASSLQELSIIGCSELRCLPESIRHLASLQFLIIFGCSELRCLPESIGHLASLGILKLYNCEKLSEIGEWVGELKSLRYLDISNCPGLTSLPNGMRHLALDRLNISECPGLKEIGEWVGELKSLRYLDISKCPGLTSLPNGMRHLTLHELFIFDCPRLEEWCERSGISSHRSLASI